MKRTIIAGAAAAIIAAVVVGRRPSEPPSVSPLVVWLCCESDGSHCEETAPAACSPAKDIVSCCAPATEPDGTVSCGC